MIECANCGKEIYAAFTAPDGYVVWSHLDMHTVCNWHEDMQPTDVVAAPRAQTASERIRALRLATL